MAMKKLALMTIALITLSACALTPEQKVAREQAQAQERLRLQMLMAKQCDPETATLMEKLPHSWEMSEAEKKTFDAQYNEKINNPIFQSCYKMAWQAYINQANIELMEQRNMQMQMDDWMWRRPMRCQGWHNGRPFWYGC
jgi:hypothetical protein